jgi:cytoskeletal protein RodZ
VPDLPRIEQYQSFGPRLASKPFYMLNQECTPMDTSQLAAEARAAYEQRRTRDCIALTTALMQADPENEEAQALQSAIRADIQQDLRDARGLLEQSGTNEEKKKYRKAAEIILLKTLHLDSENEEARVLLQSARAMSGMPHVVARKPDEIPFVAAPPLGQKTEKKRNRFKIPFALFAIVILLGGLFLVLRSRRTSPGTLAASVPRTEPVNHTESQRASADAQYVPAPLPVAVTTSPSPTPAAAAPQPAAVPAPAPAAPAANVPAADMGKLSVSSPTEAEIYLGNRYLGSTPATLQLPVGRQTLEYRHGNLRTVVTHSIKPSATTATSVTFQVTVQINAKPWAQVFLEGTPRRQLGQTPLSGVVVPIGGVLVFENPNFPNKSYRITDTDSAIQVNFQ